MRPRRNFEGGSLDSLLDTMTNVVGILVIMLVVTQLGVRDAVSRISQNPTVSPEALAAAESEREELDAQRAELERRLAAFGSQQSVEDLDQLTGDLTAAQRQLGALQREHEEAEARIRPLQKKIEENKKLAEKLKTDSDDLEKQIDAAEKRIEELKAQLAVTSIPDVLPAKEVIIPNPRKAPEGAKRIEFLCHAGRVIPLYTDELRDRAQKRAKYIVDRYRLGRDKAKGIEGEELVKYFNKERIRDDYVELEMTVRGRYPSLVIHPRKDAGETIKDLQQPASRFRRLTMRINPKSQYLRFIVWTDSFETYLEARSVAAKRGLLAGWTPKTVGYPHTMSLGGPLRVGPAPKPKPPGPKPPQPPKPKPVDEID
jgi:hypothetical protein